MVLLTATLVFAVAHAVSAAAASVQSGPKPPRCAITEQQVLKFATKYRKDILWSGVAKVPKQRLRKPPKPSKKKSRSLETRADTRTPWQNQASWYWMNYESDNKLISELSIPGTHDSATPGSYTRIYADWIVTQSLYIPSQLASGIRYLDFRLGWAYEDDRLWMYHGDEQLQNDNGDNMLFENIIAQVYDFLRAEKTETVIVSIKLDYRDDSVSIPFDDAVMKIINYFPDMWCRQDWSKTGSPRLGDCRGKAILFARFDWEKQQPMGLHLGSDFRGNDDTKFAKFNYGKGSVTVSDWYSVESDSFYTAPVVNAKYEVVAKALRSAYNTNDRNNVKITFSSGYQSNGLAKTTPRTLAIGNGEDDGVNQRIGVVLGSEAKGKNNVGIVVMDFSAIPSDLAYKVVYAAQENPPVRF